MGGNVVGGELLDPIVSHFAEPSIRGTLIGPRRRIEGPSTLILSNGQGLPHLPFLASLNRYLFSLPMPALSLGVIAH